MSNDAPFHGFTAVPNTPMAAVPGIGGGGHRGLQGLLIRVCGVSMDAPFHGGSNDTIFPQCR